MKDILLKTDSLSKSFSSGGALQHVLRNIDLELYRGDFTVIMGEWIRRRLARSHSETRIYRI